MYTTHTADQLAVVRTAAAERQRRADEYRTMRSREVDGRTDPSVALVSLLVGALFGVVAFSSLAPATATVLDGDHTTAEDTYTGSATRLLPGRPDGFWTPDGRLSELVPAAGRVR